MAGRFAGRYPDAHILETGRYPDAAGRVLQNPTSEAWKCRTAPGRPWTAHRTDLGGYVYTPRVRRSSGLRHQ